MTDKGWSRAFDDPIPLPGSGQLRTLRDAGNNIAKLPRREHDAFAWRPAIEAFIYPGRQSTPSSQPFIFEHFSNTGVVEGETAARRQITAPVADSQRPSNRARCSKQSARAR
jgi:hypothetical protein